MTMGSGSKPSGPYWQVQDPAFWAKQASGNNPPFTIGGGPLGYVLGAGIGQASKTGSPLRASTQSIAGGGFGRGLATGAGALMSGAGKSLLG